MKQYLCVIFLFGFIYFSFAQEISNLPLPLGAGNAEVWNGEIYHFGGSNNWSGSTVYPRVYKFDGLAWTHQDTIPDNNLWDVETVLVGNFVYLLGGWPSGPSLNRKYNLITGEWTYLATSPNTSQTWGITSEELNGVIYLFNSVGNVFAYNITDDSWTTKTSNPASGTWDMSSVLYQNEIYIIGWNDSLFYKYTPATDQWTQLANSPYQVGACAIGIINDLVYCVGGNLGGGSAATYKSIIVYNISNNAWSIDTQVLSSKRHWMATATYAGGLYVIGGIDSTAQAVNMVEEIVPQGTSGIHDESDLPRDYYMAQNYPNPFNPATKIELALPRSEFVTLKIYNVLGVEVASLVSGNLQAGIHTFQFAGSNFASGVYFYKIEAGPFAKVMKMILLQ